MKLEKFELNQANVRNQILKSGEMMEMCREKASQIAARAGEGFEVDTYVGQNRVNAMVSAATPKARRKNLKENTLLKSIGG